ncbi:MAG TPA: hypothetical protein VGT41_01855 [Candidatus Babeliales bacterium]|nr:hypothetical protein [Candidatus Babeliales bacterium]
MKTIKLIVSAGLLFGSFSLFFATDVRRTIRTLVPFSNFDTVKAITFTGIGDQTSAIAKYNKDKAEQLGVVWVSGQTYYRIYNTKQKSSKGTIYYAPYVCTATQPLFGGIKGSLVHGPYGTVAYCTEPIASTMIERGTASTLADLKFKLGL